MLVDFVYGFGKYNSGFGIYEKDSFYILPLLVFGCGVSGSMARVSTFPAKFISCYSGGNAIKLSNLEDISIFLTGTNVF